MKYYIYLVLFCFAILPINAQTNMLISDAEVSFTFISSDVEGTLGGFVSKSTIDLDQIENSKFIGSVKTETISTGNSIRNWSLKRSKYFNSETYPTISFESSSVTIKGKSIIVNGKLTIKNVTKELSFNFTKNENQLVGKATIYSSDFGITIKSDREKNKVLIQLLFQLK